MDLEKFRKIRRELHSKPELSNDEFETAKSIVSYLKEYEPDNIITGLGETGVVAEFDSKIEGPIVLVRAELDALPIQEINDFDHRSTIDKVSHMCGHDGHMTILLALASHLKKNPISRGKVKLLFQPGEENGTGAKAVLKDMDDMQYEKFDYVIALHNLPGYPKGQVVLKQNSFTAHVASLIIHLKGKTSHAAEPELGLNPSMLIAAMLNESDKMTHNVTDSDDFFLVTPIHIEMGEVAYGISAGEAVVRLTIRAWDKHTMETKSQQLLKRFDAHAAKYNIDIDYEWTHEFHANQNDNHCVNILKDVAEENDIKLVERKFPFKWGEDFGLFTQKYKGAMFGIGSGENTPALHNPDYDFPDDIIPDAVRMFAGFIDKIQSSAHV